MGQGFEMIRARTKDDVVVLIDRLMRSKQQEVVLVLPKNSIISADLNSLKILKEEAESIGKTLSLSAESDQIISFAGKIGMKVYNPDSLNKIDATETEKKPKKIKMMMDILPPSLNRLIEEVEEETSLDVPTEVLDYQYVEPKINVYEAVSKNLDLEKNLENFYDDDLKDNVLKQKSRLFRFSLNRLITFFTVSGILIFGLAMYLILPKVEIKLSLKEVPLNVQIPVAASKNVSSPDLVSGIIPGQYFLLNKSGSRMVETTSKVGGVIEIYNAYSAAPQKLVADTRFETKDGKIFRIQNPIIIPGAKMSGAKLVPSSIKTEVISDTNGEEYLIAPSFFTIPGFKETPKYAGFYGKSTQSMTVIHTASITKEELEKNKNALQDSLAQELKSETLSALKDSNLQLIDGASTIRVNDFKVNSNVISMKITWQALFFKEKDLRTLVSYFVSSHYPDLKKFSFEDNIAYPKANRADFKKGELFFTFTINKNNALPADIDTLKQELVGRDESSMRALVSDKSYINSASISLWPFWVKKAPNNLNKINITIDN